VNALSAKTVDLDGLQDDLVRAINHLCTEVDTRMIVGKWSAATIGYDNVLMENHNTTIRASRL
jgi:hypothetical protein